MISEVSLCNMVTYGCFLHTKDSLSLWMSDESKCHIVCPSILGNSGEFGGMSTLSLSIKWINWHVCSIMDSCSYSWQEYLLLLLAPIGVVVSLECSVLLTAVVRGFLSNTAITARKLELLDIIKNRGKGGGGYTCDRVVDTLLSYNSTTLLFWV